MAWRHHEKVGPGREPVARHAIKLAFEEMQQHPQRGSNQHLIHGFFRPFPLQNLSTLLLDKWVATYSGLGSRASPGQALRIRDRRHRRFPPCPCRMCFCLRRSTRPRSLFDHLAATVKKYSDLPSQSRASPRNGIYDCLHERWPENYVCVRNIFKTRKVIGHGIDVLEIRGCDLENAWITELEKFLRVVDFCDVCD
jgi:hypothetical protein